MIIAGIVAGGTGSRMGMGMPKQFLMLDSMPILMHTVARFATHRDVDIVIIGVHSEWVEYTKQLLETYRKEEWRAKVAVVPGGADRNDTLLAILEGARVLFGAGEDTVVLSHDAVRPFVTEKIISLHVDAMRIHRVTTTTIPAVDTILYSEDGVYVTEVPERRTMFHAQTPQSFRLGDFENLCRGLTVEARRRATDVCGICREYGIPVYMVEGDAENQKITYANDYKAACEKRLHNKEE